MTMFLGVIFPNADGLEWISTLIALVGWVIVLFNYLESLVERRVARVRKKHPIYLDTANEVVRKDRMRLEFLTLWFIVGALAMYSPANPVSHSWVVVFARLTYMWVEARTVIESYLEKRYKMRLDAYTKTIMVIDRTTGKIQAREG